MIGRLYVVATPIGNLNDTSFRTLEILRSVDLIACEDTRQTLKLLNHFEIKNELISYHMHSGQSKAEKILNFLAEGREVALVSDAGTPGISDPGEVLVRKAVEAGVAVFPIPGPAAAIAALSVSGLSAAEFTFFGFLPHKKGRQTKLKEIIKEKRTVILYESPYRIKKLLGELLEFAGDRNVFVAREITKKFEEHYRGKISEVLPTVKEKGEFVVVLESAND